MDKQALSSNGYCESDLVVSIVFVDFIKMTLGGFSFSGYMK
jgi:hypothetical protein